MNAKALAVLLAATLAAPAAAQDFIVYGGVALEFLNRPDGDSEPNVSSVEAYVEGEVAGFYFGVWALRANVEGYDEIDLYLGYRNELDSGLSYDLSYYRYIDPDDRDADYGELIFGVDQSIGETVELSLDLAWDPDSELGNAYLGIEVYPAEKWAISANYGSYQVEDAASEQEWDFGATYYVTDEAAVDLRWYDGSEYVQGYAGLFLSFDTTLFGG